MQIEPAYLMINGVSMGEVVLRLEFNLVVFFQTKRLSLYLMLNQNTKVFPILLLKCYRFDRSYLKFGACNICTPLLLCDKSDECHIYSC